MRLKRVAKAISLLVMIVLTTSCTTMNYRGEGAVGGLAVGAGVGYAFGGKLGAAAGGTGGALLGGLVGSLFSKSDGVAERDMGSAAKLEELYERCLRNEHNRAAVKRKPVSIDRCDKLFYQQPQKQR